MIREGAAALNRAAAKSSRRRDGRRLV